MNKPLVHQGPLNRREVIQLAAASAAAISCESLFGQSSGPSESRPAVGVNLSQVRYWTSDRPFNNLFLVSSPHVPLKKKGGGWNNGGSLDVDANGWIRRFQPGQLAAFIIDLKAGHANTVYEVLYQGSPSAVRIQGGTRNMFMKKKRNARLLVRMSSPIRNVIVREKGFRSTETFATRFVNRCRQFHTLRFMDWQGTNDNRKINWQTRVTDKYYTQAGKEVALEHMVELCNITSSAMWYCSHHRADDQYVRSAARFLKDKLKNGRPVYLEHSNEVWNSHFSQHHFCKKQNENWMQYHIQRTAEIARLFRAEGVEVVSVLGLQSAGTWSASQALKEGVPDDIDATAIAPYFGGRVCRKPEAVKAILSDEGVERILVECGKDMKQRWKEVKQHRRIADKQGLQMLGYEGGQHLIPIGPQRKNKRLVRLLIEANRHPGMYDLYREYLQTWKTETDDSLMCLYYSVGIPNQSGYWGLLEYDGQPLRDAPKHRAAIDFLNGTASS